MIPALCLSLVICFNTVSHHTVPLIANHISWSQSSHPAAVDKPGSSQTPPASAKPQEPAVPLSPLGEALASYRKGDFDHAIEKYRQLLVETPKSPDAYAGLTRVYLKKKDVQQAYDTVTKGLQVSDSHVLHTALGEVYFRQGRIADAEHEWITAVNSGFWDARAYLGLARVRWAVCMYRSGRAAIEKAHALDPTDPEITNLWVEKQSREERIQYWQQHLEGQTNDDAESKTARQHYLEFLLARAKAPQGACHLVSRATTTETKLIPLRIDPKNVHGYRLAVAVNNKKSELQLDTGASGFLINRGLAERAGVTRLSDANIRGIGDKGPRSGYVGLAKSLKIGELEFQDCPVEVIEQGSAVGEEGLIGTDVFSAFLVDIDFPNERLHLRELPKRPGEAGPKITLQTESGSSDSPGDEEKAVDPKARADAPPLHTGPQDAYIAPEMKSYTRVFRFGHDLLVPTSIGDAPLKLFLLDTGAAYNCISPRAAREVTKVHGDSDLTIKGLNGAVKDVYLADKTVIHFGNLRQENQHITSFDLTNVSDQLGTEMSGILGFQVLRMLDIKIDYRDGVVDFSYDPKRWVQAPQRAE